jgi:RimJ/RimL family protein N-acetyltransferase
MQVPLLETECLVLRPFYAEDAEALFAYASAPEFSQYVEYESPRSLTDAQYFLEHVLLPESDDQLSWAVCLRGEAPVVGTIQVTLDAPDTLTVHYDIAHWLYGKGYTTEALRAVLHWSLVHLPHVEYLLGDTVTTNTGSRRVMEKCGFTPYKTEVVEWEKWTEPVELVFYRAKRSAIMGTVETS